MRRGALSRTLAFRSVAALIFALSLAGCAVGPDYSPRPRPMPTKFKELKGWKVATPSDAPDRGDWWRFYRDPKLDLLLKQVEISNQTVAAAGRSLRAGARPHPGGASGAVPDIDTATTTPRARIAGRVAGGAGAVASATRRRHLFDDFHAAARRHLGPRRLGQSAPPDREQHLGGAGERRRPRQRQALRSRRCLPPPISICAPPIRCAISSTARSRNTRRRCESCRTNSTPASRPRLGDVADRRFAPQARDQPKRRRSMSACSARNSSTPSPC